MKLEAKPYPSDGILEEDNDIVKSDVRKVHEEGY
jgi:hypothetical protein